MVASAPGAEIVAAPNAVPQRTMQAEIPELAMPEDAAPDPAADTGIAVHENEPQLPGEEETSVVSTLEETASPEPTIPEEPVLRAPRTTIPDFMDEAPEEDASDWPLSQNIPRARFDDEADIIVDRAAAGEWSAQRRRAGS